MRVIVWYDPTSHTLKIASEKNFMILKKPKRTIVLTADAINIPLPEEYEVERTLKNLYLQGYGKIALVVSLKGNTTAFIYDKKELKRVLQRIQQHDKNLAEAFGVALNMEVSVPAEG